MQRADAFGQEDRVPVGQGDVGQVAGWASTAPLEGDIGGHARGQRIEVGVGTRTFDAHDFVECARAREGAPPSVHVRGRVGDVHGFVASGDACEDVDLAADFRTDEAGGQADAALTVAGEVHLRKESAGVRSPIRADEGALVGASPRQGHDVDATAHRPRARAGGQADVSGQDDARDAVFRHGGRGQRAGRVDEDAARFDVDARARIDGRGRDSVYGIGQALLARCREHEGGSDARVAQTSPGRVPIKVEQRRVGEDPRERVGVRGLGEFVDNGRIGVGQAQRRESRTGHEARVGRADSGSRQVMVAMVVVVDHSPAEGIVSCTRVVVCAVGSFRGEPPFEGFAH